MNGRGIGRRLGCGVVISNILMSHFRSHRQVRLRFDGRPVALHGPNGAGKTNILEALSLLSPGRGLRRAAPEDFARKPEGLGWKIAASVETHEVETWAEPGAGRQVRIDGKLATQPRLAGVVRMLWLVPMMDRLWLEAPEGRRRFVDRMAMSFAPDHAEAALDYDKAMRERNRLLRDGVVDAHWYGALEARMAEAAARIDANREAALARLGRAFMEASDAFPVPDLRLEMPEPYEDLAEALGQQRRRDMAAGRSLSGPHRADLAAFWPRKGVAAAQASTGEQKALLISILLANARALAQDTGQAPVLLLDEVAAHLDPRRRAALYDEICALRCQCFLTGTEAALFADLGARGQQFVVQETGGTSEISEVTP